jgi:hypothetical protein
MEKLMPRKSASSLGIAPLAEPVIMPESPRTLVTERQKQIWADCITSRPLTHWDRPSQALLAELVSHLDLFERCSDEINAELGTFGQRDHDRINQLSIVRAREGRLVQSMASKLRLTPSSVLTQAAGRTAKEHGGKDFAVKPWQEGAAKRKAVKADGAA